MLKKLALGAALAAAMISHVAAQGQFPSGYVFGNSTASPGQGSPQPQSAMFDRAFGSTSGMFAARGASAWGAGTFGAGLAFSGSVLSIDLAHANTWSATQTFPNNSLTLAEFPAVGANTVLGSGPGGTPAALNLGQGLNSLTAGSLQVERLRARFWPKPSQSTTPTVAWNAVDPWGSPITCTGTNSQCLNEFNAAVSANGWGAQVSCQGTQFPSGAEPIFINSTVTIALHVMQDADYHIDGTCNFNVVVTNTPGVTVDSIGAGITDLLGKVVYQPSAPNGNTTTNPSCAILVNPTTNTADGFPGVYASRLRIKAPVVAPSVQQNVTGAVTDGGLIRLTVASTSGWTTGDVKSIASVGGVPNATGAFTITVIDATHIDLQSSTFAGAYTSGGTVTGVATAAICFNTSTGSTIQNHEIVMGEVNANNLAFYGVLIFGASPTTGFLQNLDVKPGQVHGALLEAIAVGINTSNQTNYSGNIWTIGSCQNAIIKGAAAARCLDSYATADIYDIGLINNAQGGLTQGWVLESGSANNQIRYAGIFGNTGAAFIDNGTCNSYSGPQGSTLSVFGTTGGCTQLVAAPSASGKVTLPSATDTIALLGLSQTLSNKTLANAIINTPTISGGTLDNTAIGSTTPSSAAFTTVTASSTVGGAGFSAYLASPPAVGGTAPAAGTFTTLNGQAGNSTTNVRAGGKICASAASVGNTADAGPDTLQTCSIPANTLDAVGRGIRIETWGVFAANANTKTVTVTWGGTTIYTSTGLTSSNTNWMVWCNILKGSSANTQTTACTGVFQNSVPDTNVNPTTITETSAQNIITTGASGSSAANDIISKGQLVTVVN